MDITVVIVIFLFVFLVVVEILMRIIRIGTLEDDRGSTQSSDTVCLTSLSFGKTTGSEATRCK